MPKKKQITESSMGLLRRTLKGYDKTAIWAVLKRLKLSPKDAPFYSVEEIDEEDLVSDEPWGFGSDDVSYIRHHYYLGDVDGDNRSVSVLDFATRKNYTNAMAALSHGTFEDFKLFEEFKADQAKGHKHGTVRQWRRAFVNPQYCLSRLEVREPSATGLTSLFATEMLMKFFVSHPGLRRFIGIKVSLYYNPCNAEELPAPDEKSAICVIM